jgi:hypothetical protein
MRCTLKKSTTSRIFTRASQPLRNKTLLSKLATRARRRRLSLRAQVKKKKKKIMMMMMRKMRKIMMNKR